MKQPKSKRLIAKPYPNTPRLATDNQLKQRRNGFGGGFEGRAGSDAEVEHSGDAEAETDLRGSQAQMRLPIFVHIHYYSPMERIVHKARDFQAATEWDIEQQLKMTPNERRAVARKLKQRVYGNDSKDVRECHQTK